MKSLTDLKAFDAMNAAEMNNIIGAVAVCQTGGGGWITGVAGNHDQFLYSNDARNADGYEAYSPIDAFAELPCCDD